MKEYIFKIIGTGLFNYYQANIEIYREKKLINKGTSYNGLYKTLLEKNSFYKIIINNMAFVIHTSNSDFCFNVNANIIKRFILTDQFYIGLPIKKGVLLLWQSK